MKNYQLSFLYFLVSLLFVSCAEEDPAPENPLDANKKVEVWKSDKAASISLLHGAAGASDSLKVIGFKQNGRIELKVKFNGVGTYTLAQSGVVSFYELVDGKETASTYSLDANDKTSELIITKWNPATKELEATFQVTLKKAASGGASVGPESLRFTGGEVKGTATMARKGVVWKAGNVKSIVLKKGLQGADSLVIEDENAAGKIWIHLRFSGVRKYGIPQVVMVSYTELDAQGARKGSYYLNHLDPAKSEAEVTITEWNPDTKAMKGTFRFNLKKDYWGTTPPQEPVVEEYLEFSGGEFKGVVTVL
ncbi:DUF6252 family protein [Rufibacter glacialis]|uniref:DUF6252 family protein n=1 Tax=Rufibacter glacialis TaxID=1259555 RepID=A0A5M8QKW0_9BACT|nr:DUF6252 family protein [Rufibacter glacialis]KAA6435620.1 hypothetical protein FOE74_06675 [Rufibacter glacialis]GGK65048.1 hypothetical protein GCM10011405_11330 [Rufibacter glacialis]